MKGYRKTDVDIYHERRGAYPSVYVKADRFGRGLSETDFNCSEKVYEKALEFAFSMAQHSFWDEDTAQDLCEQYLGRGKVYSAGRSGGHLIVEGLPPVEDWDGVMLNKWALFERAIKREVEYLCSADKIKGDIDANRWAEEGAEEYNFIDYKDGRTACIAELKKQAVENGFGAVVR